MSAYRGDLELAQRLADRADEISMRAFSSGDREHTRKEDGGPVTQTDLAIESILRSDLARDRDSDEVFGEEFGGERTGERVWLIDPIDGTGSFIKGGVDWCTLIALVEQGRPVVGVVSRPVAGTRWWGAAELGAFRNGLPIHVSRRTDLAEAVIQEDFRVSVARRLQTNPVWSVARECAAVRPWDQFYFMAIAEGAADFAVNWWSGWGPDLASQVCILEAAGGRFSDLHGVLDIDAEVHVISNRLLHDHVLALVNDVVLASGLDPAREPTEDLSEIWRARARQPAEPWRVDA